MARAVQARKFLPTIAMPSIKQPVTQKRLTNVAVVKLKSGGVNFEIAAYKNKVLDWREGIEKDMNEVLQIVNVYTNVEKGDVAKNADLKKVFGTTDKDEICRKILKSGQLQVSDRERELHMEGLFRDIVQIVVERCVHPQSGRQLTAMTVESALRTVGFSVSPEHTAKKQALVAIKVLCAELPDSFARSKMRLAINCPQDLKDEIQKYLKEQVIAKIEEETPAVEGGLCSFTFSCEPSHYRDLDRLVTVEHIGKNVSLHLICTSVVGEAAIEKNTPQPEQPEPQNKREPAPQPKLNQQEEPKKVGIRCSACNVDFEGATDYRQHCRSEWHNFNLKRKVKGLSPLTEEDYAEVALDVREGFLAVES